MTTSQKLFRSRFVIAGITLAAIALGVAKPATAQQYEQQNLVSNVAGMAPTLDPNLKNPWGIVASATSPFWISDNNAGVSTLYTGAGNISPLVVKIPSAMGAPAGSLGAPTGVVFNGTPGFVITKGSASGAALFIFSAEDGTISGWRFNVDLTNAILVVDNSDPNRAHDGSKLGAVYKGLAIGNNGSGEFIYAANFRDGFVEMYDSNFKFMKSFTDPSIVPDAPNPGFAPFGIQNINGKLYVTFAIQNSERHDDVKGRGNGFVDVFDLNGNFERRFATGGKLNSPWGLALAPANFGKFSGDVLVGNFGDGRINAFEPGDDDHSFEGQLKGPHGKVIMIDGLWGLTFGNGKAAGATNELFFTAGINAEADGLFGKITAAGEEDHEENAEGE